jgi:hypothetical protein
LYYLAGRLAAARGRRFRRWAASLCAMLLFDIFLLSAGAQAASPSSPALTRAPYLTDLVGSHVNVNWATDQSASTGSVQWGPVTDGNCTLSQTQTATRSSIAVGAVTEYQWKAPLALPNGGVYCYRPLLAGADLLGANASPQFQSQAAAGDTSPFSFDVFGDWGQVDANGNNADQGNLFARVAASGARFAVTVGDNGYPNGSQQNYGDLQQKGADTSAIFGPSFWSAAGSTVPLFTAAGNHGLSGPAHTDITTWTQDSAVSSSAGRYQNDVYCCVNGSSSANYGSEWYAFDAGSARFYVLDSAWGDSNPGTASVYANDAAAHFAPGTPEYQWLLNDLQTHPSSLKFAFSHYPFYADNPTQPSDTSLQGLTGLEGMLGQYGVNISFNGHAHLYERNVPSAPGMPVTYVTGGGGAALEPVGPCHPYDAYGIGWSPSKLTGSACGAAHAPTSAANVFHFLKVTVSGMTVTVAPTDETGQTFDVQTYTFTNVPDTVIDSAPAALTNSSNATFAFHSTRAGATFGCSLDGVPATACTSPAAYTLSTDGPHSFSVVATTTAGGTDPTPAVARWTVDTSPPSTPTNVTASSPSATVVNLSWRASTDNMGVTSYDVQRNGVTIGSATAPTTSYLDATAAPSTTYQYAVVARDAAGNSSAASSPVSVTTPRSTGAPTFVQSAGSSTTTVTLPGTSASGDLLVLTAGVYTGASKPITAVSDGKNTWTKVGTYAVSGQNSDGEMWFTANAAPVRSVTVTTTAAVALTLQEFTGVATSSPLDGSIGTATTSTSASSGTVTPTTTKDLAVGFVAGHANTQAISVTSPGYAVGPQQSTGGSASVTVVSGSQTLSTTGPQSFSGTFTNAMYWSAGIALFKASAPPPPSDDFAITASPASVTATAGQTATTTISTSVTGGNAQAVTLTASSAPSGATLSFSPASITSGQSSTLTIATASGTPAGTYSIAVTGAGPSATHTTTVSLTVNAVVTDDFAISSVPSSASVTAGQSVTTSIVTALTSGSAQTVMLTASGTPSGATVSFSPASITSGQSSTMTVTTSTGTPAGTSTLVITGTGSAATHTTTVALTVKAVVTDDFAITASPSSVTATAGQTATTTINTRVTSGNAQTVTLSASGTPSGATVSFTPASITSGQSSTLAIATTSATPAGGYSLVVTGTGPAATHTVTVAFTVVAGSIPSLVQAVGATEASASTSLTATLPKPSAAGDLLVLSASVYSGSTNNLTSVTDSAGNVWKKIKAWNTASHYSDGEMWYTAGAASTTTVTVHLASATSVALEVHEFAGIAATNPLDVSAGSSNTSASANSGPVTPSASGELLIGFVAGHGSTQTMTVIPAGYTVQPQQTTTGTAATLVTGYQVLSPATTVSFGASFPTAMYWAAGLATFKSAS